MCKNINFILFYRDICTICRRVKNVNPRMKVAFFKKIGPIATFIIILLLFELKKYAICLICQESIAMMKEYNLKLHYGAGTRLSTIEPENRCDVAILYRRILLLTNRIHLNVNVYK